MSCDLYTEITKECTFGTRWGSCYGVFLYVDIPGYREINLAPTIGAAIIDKERVQYLEDGRFKVHVFEHGGTIQVFERKAGAELCLGDKVEQCGAPYDGNREFCNDAVIVALDECKKRALLFNPDAKSGHEGAVTWAINEGCRVAGFHSAHWEVPTNLLHKVC